MRDKGSALNFFSKVCTHIFHKNVVPWVVCGLVCAQLFVWWKINLWSFLMGQVQLWDFDVYWQMSRDVWSGQNPLHVPYMQTAGPPLVIAPYFIFNLFSLPLSRGMLTFCSVIAVAVSAWLLSGVFTQVKPNWRHCSTLKLTVALSLQLLCWLAFPTRFTVLLGQPNLIMMGLVVCMLSIKKPQWQGIFSGLLIVFKTNLVVLLASLAGRYTSQPQFLSYCLLTISCIVVLVSPWLKISYYAEYMMNRAPGYVTTTPQPATTDYYNQSLRSTFHRLQLAPATPMVWLILVVGAGFWLYKKQSLGDGLILSLLISPITWSHYVVLVYPVLVLTWFVCWQLRSRLTYWHWVGLAASSIFLIIEIKTLHAAPLTLLTGLAASHYFFGLGVLLVVRAVLPAHKLLSD